MKVFRNKKILFLTNLCFLLNACSLQNNFLNNDVDLKSSKREIEENDYYKIIEEECESDCCFASLRKMRDYDYKLSSSQGCPAEYKINYLECSDSLKWCEPEDVEDEKKITKLKKLESKNDNEVFNWQLYHNRSQKLFIKYPKSWQFLHDVDQEKKLDYELLIGFFDKNASLDKRDKYPIELAVVSEDRIVDNDSEIEFIDELSNKDGFKYFLIVSNQNKYGYISEKMADTFELKDGNNLSDKLDSSWQIYQNEIYGFLFQYPKIFGQQNVVDDQNIIFVSDDEKQEIFINFESGELPDKEDLSDLYGDDNLEEIFVDDILFYRIFEDDNDCQVSRYKSQITSNKILNIDLKTCGDDIYFENQIISSFKLLDIYQNWQVYQNQNVGIKFRYPKTWNKSEISDEDNLKLIFQDENNSNTNSFSEAMSINFIKEQKIEYVLGYEDFLDYKVDDMLWKFFEEDNLKKYYLQIKNGVLEVVVKSDLELIFKLLKGFEKIG